eukprot:TRINITY_DN24602_c0_g1_i1.p2 TRINITY_DN24602_c0_g1~~TRINITY_DN24602_c0_g1_i1.p2  ORF type:complete len:107 (-),score=27.54 TRINITY_DN24602_c0_g1_i1:408-728(-)
MGNSVEGTSSGLHHDFHDNLYVLLRGKKQFTLYPPSDAHDLYTEGQVVEIHPNGLITYEPRTSSDGVPDGAELGEEHTDDEEAALDRLLEQGCQEEHEDGGQGEWE